MANPPWPSSQPTHPQGLSLAPRRLTNNSESSVGQRSDVWAQLASQVQATIGINPQIASAHHQQSQGPAAPQQPNMAVAHYTSTQPLASHQTTPPAPQVPGLAAASLWNPTAAQPGNNNMTAAAYQIPSNWSGTNSHMTMNRPGHYLNPSQMSQNQMTSASIVPALTTSSLVPPDFDGASVPKDGDWGSNARSFREDGDGNNKKTSSAKIKQNRERNREHARSTRLRKKAYVQKLNEMAGGLRALQTDEIRQRRLAVHQMAEKQKTRKRLVQKFLHFHSNFEADPQAWRSLVEEDFWLKQPVTPFRSFQRSEVERDCRITRGVEALICDAASISTMLEQTGSRNPRWQRIKRRQFDRAFEMPGVQIPPFESNQQVESSLSSSSSTASSDDSLSRRNYKSFTRQEDTTNPFTTQATSRANKVSSSSGESSIKRKRKHSNGKETAMATAGHVSTSSETESANTPPNEALKTNWLPSNVARSGGIVHNIAPVHCSRPVQKMGPYSAQQMHASISPVPSQAPLSMVQLKEKDGEEIGAYYAINEDNMIMIDDVLMCPFVFRTKNAVLCGALTDCVMPGMIRANFSKANTLQSMEMVYDAMGFMQQFDGANGGQVTAQVIPGSLEMALMGSPNEARVITEARPPFAVVHVNEAWTRLTKYNQIEVEGRELLSLLEGEYTDPSAKTRPGKPEHKLEEVARGRSACSTNLHYDKLGNTFVDFMFSYPLTNSDGEISHLLHVCLELSKDPALV